MLQTARTSPNGSLTCGWQARSEGFVAQARTHAPVTYKPQNAHTLLRSSMHVRHKRQTPPHLPGALGCGWQAQSERCCTLRAHDTWPPDTPAPVQCACVYAHACHASVCARLLEHTQIQKAYAPTCACAHASEYTSQHVCMCCACAFDSANGHANCACYGPRHTLSALDVHQPSPLRGMSSCCAACA